MKMKTLLALGLCLAHTLPLLAQDKEIKELDSVYITPFAGCKIVLVGRNIEKLMKENNLQILKNKFIQDYQESAKDKDFPATAKNIIYLAGADGRRRLKAIPDETAPVDIKAEITAFNSNLPPFHYTIYDLTKNYTYHIYVPSLEALDELAKVDCSKSVLEATANASSLRRFTTVSLAATDTGFTINQRTNRKRDLLAIFGSANGLVVNNGFSPGLGLNLELQFSNRYGTPKYKFGVEGAINFFADVKDNTTTLYNINSSTGYFLKNLGTNRKEVWLGLSTGRFSSFAEPDSSKNGVLYKARKYGIISQYNNWGLEYNFIVGKNDKVTAGLTLRYYF